MAFSPKILPITIIDSNKPVAQEAHEHHHAQQGDGPRSLGQPAPCMLHVGDTAISEADIAREMQFHRALTPEQSRADAARALVVRELLRQEIERQGIAWISSPQGNETAEEASIRTLLERDIEDRQPDEADCRRYYEQNRASFRSPDRVRLRHILLATPADDVAGRLAARSHGEKLIAEIQANPPAFTDLAMRCSHCPSRDQGGDLGWLERGQTTPEFDRQIFRLRTGLAGFPVESRWGYHVVMVDELAPGEPISFEQARGQISDYLELQVRQREVQHYLQMLQERYPVKGLDAIEALAA